MNGPDILSHVASMEMSKEHLKLVNKAFHDCVERHPDDYRDRKAFIMGALSVVANVKVVKDF